MNTYRLCMRSFEFERQARNVRDFVDAVLKRPEQVGIVQDATDPKHYRLYRNDWMGSAVWIGDVKLVELI